MLTIHAGSLLIGVVVGMMLLTFVLFVYAAYSSWRDTKAARSQKKALADELSETLEGLRASIEAAIEEDELKSALSEADELREAGEARYPKVNPFNVN